MKKYLKSLILALSVPAMAAPINPRTGPSMALGTPTDLSFELVRGRHLENELIVKGVMFVSTLETVQLESVRFSHPTTFFGTGPHRSRRIRANGRIEIQVAAVKTLPGVEKAIVDQGFAMRVKLDSREQVDAKNPVFVSGPKFPAVYEIFVNGTAYKVVSLGINGLITLDDLPQPSPSAVRR